jgi:hypothetical protein
MPDLLQSLHKFDIGYLRITASLWGVELTASGTEEAARELAARLLEPELGREIIESLSREARRVLAALVRAGGKIPWAAFTRQAGEIRQAGPGRRDREQVYRAPVSAAEVLFYRALVARAFFDTPSGVQEFAYIPDDLLPTLRGFVIEGREDEKSGASLAPVPGRGGQEPLGRLASPVERRHVLPASDRILDDAVTLLAALRTGIQPPGMSLPLDALGGFLRAAGILAGNEPSPEKLKVFLEMPRPEALSLLSEAWQGSETFDELRQVPGLVCEGEWQETPLAARTLLLGYLDAVPAGRWWSLPAFLHDLKEGHPDFQRPAGDYDSWFIKRASDGAYLRGFSSWDEVDGALVRFLVTGPLFWLERVDLASAEQDGQVTAFRKRPDPPTTGGEAKLSVASNGKIAVPPLVPRVARYQISRFCEWDEPRPDEYRYHVTVASLQRAGRQGLKISQLLSLLAKNAAAEIPPAFVRALKRWEKNGTEARLAEQVILKVARPEVLEELRKSKAGRFLGEALGPTAVIVKPGAVTRVLAALAELGLLAESSTTVDEV